ncbi:PHP domain-containing protein [Acidobacteriota bacterium]
MRNDAGDIDLHVHSNQSSDGDFSPSNLIQLAKEKRLKALAISDHDTVAAFPQAIAIGRDVGIEVIPSMELTTLYDDREFHLLLPFVDWRRQIVKDLTEQVAARRFQEAKERVEKLQDLGFQITWKEVLKESGDHPPLGVTIAQLLLKKAEANGDLKLNIYFEEENRLYAPYFFYRDYFAEGRPAAVPRRNISLIDVLQMVNRTGGVPVLAHPGASFQRVTREDLSALKKVGLQGLEVYSSYHDSAMAEFFGEMAEEFDLVPTAGSDFHGRIKPKVKLGSIANGGYWMVEELKKRRPE